METDEGGHACLIAGLCSSEVRATGTDYVDHAAFEPLPGAVTAAKRSSEDQEVHDRVRYVVANFLLSPATADCRRLEKRKYLQKRHQALWRVLRQKKRESPYSLPTCARLWLRSP